GRSLGVLGLRALAGLAELLGSRSARGRRLARPAGRSAPASALALPLAGRHSPLPRALGLSELRRRLMISHRIAQFVASDSRHRVGPPLGAGCGLPLASKAESSGIFTK